MFFFHHYNNYLYYLHDFIPVLDLFFHFLYLTVVAAIKTLNCNVNTSNWIHGLIAYLKFFPCIHQPKI